MSTAAPERRAGRAAIPRHRAGASTAGVDRQPRHPRQPRRQLPAGVHRPLPDQPGLFAGAAGLVLGAAGLGNVLGNTIGGYLADQLGRRWTIVLSGIATAGLTAVIPLLDTLP